MLQKRLQCTFSLNGHNVFFKAVDRVAHLSLNNVASILGWISNY